MAGDFIQGLLIEALVGGEAAKGRER